MTQISVTSELQHGVRDVGDPSCAEGTTPPPARPGGSAPWLTNDDDTYGRPDGHRYDAPESDEDRSSQELGLRRSSASSWSLILVLIATGTVPIFDF